MIFEFDRREGPAQWGSHQPKFERLEREDPDRYFLVYRLPSNEPVRVQLAPAPQQETGPGPHG